MICKNPFVPLLGKCVKGTIQVVAADNLGAHSIADFNESFSGGNILHSNTGRDPNELCEIRIKELHDSHVNLAQQNSSSCFGVKQPCVITKNLAHFSVLTGYPPDIMHDVFEGIVPVELAHCFSLLISKTYFSLELLNKSILSFTFKWSDKTNRPHVIPRTFSKTIGGNAHENWALIRFPPFIIGHLVPEDEMAWQILMVLKDVVELVVAPTHTEDSIAYLECKISEHHKRYQELFPNAQLLPKHTVITKNTILHSSGSLVHSFLSGQCDSRLSSFFKRVIRHSNCFKNVPLSLAFKHQLMISYHMRASSFEKPVLEMTSVSVSVDVLKDEIVEDIKQRFPGTREVHLTRSVSTKGVSFKKYMIIAHGSTSGLPDFGQIVHIFVIQERLFFMVKRLSGWYSEHHRAFELMACPTKDIDLIELSDLADECPLADYFVGSLRMVGLKYKLANYRRKLKRLGCPEVELNSLTNKPADKCSPAYGVKKPRRAEVNYCPTYPSGESAETLEKIRETLLLEVRKRNNEDTVAAMMEKTFAHRRQEVICDAPLIADFKTRWPALFCVRELTAEFKRITTVSLLSKFFSELDAHSSNLMRLFGKKGGIQGRKIRSIMIPITQTDAIDVRRECIIKALCVYLNEEPENLVKEYMNTDGESSEAAMMETTFGIFVIRKEGAEPDVGPEDVGIVLEGVQVLDELGIILHQLHQVECLVCTILLGNKLDSDSDSETYHLLWSCCLRFYPPQLRYTFEALQKIIMELDGNRLSKKNQTLKTLLAQEERPGADGVRCTDQLVIILSVIT
ncbi:hypothetical protein N1851_007633 [Merluccius polli]|uniref:Uncharacterized protein n=1 Tax=Merluccius polli TaxID=89951 RepID=A0AA47N3V1_MERPO|nr:hypothetical protein N1851_007633 [Merluccius polli]